MAFYYKILGQAAPTDTNNADIYTVTSGRQAVISSIVVCNTTTSAATFRIFQRIDGAAAGVTNAIVYDQSLAAKTTASIELKLTVDSLDVITVQSGTANALTFTVNGSEIY